MARLRLRLHRGKELIMDRNPCLSCDLRDEDKNGRRCMECDDRVEYVSGLAGRTHSVPVENTDLIQAVCIESERAAKKGNKMTILEERVEEIIKEVCDEFGVDVARLKAGGYGRGTSYAPARKKIAERLIANYGMSQQKIAELTGVSDQSISNLLRKKTNASPKGSAGQEKTTDAIDILHKRYIGDDPKRKASLQAERNKKAEPKSAKTVTIDFSEHAELLEKLGKYAKIEIRSIEDQILYFVSHSLSREETEPEKLEE